MPVVSKYFLRVFLLSCNLITYVSIKDSPHSGKCFCQQQHLKLWANQGSIQMKHRVGKSLVVASFFFFFIHYMASERTVWTFFKVIFRASDSKQALA